mmetsp:Transcript_21592/g.51206  ORF Transcript_21592/g.51206 Transcript_21592/m.51206 type:complete len:361 (+) Transcript_21592:569-1651(+)
MPAARHEDPQPHRRRHARCENHRRRAGRRATGVAPEGDGRARHRRAPPAPGRPLQAAGAGPRGGLPAVHHAQRVRRGRRRARAGPRPGRGAGHADAGCAGLRARGARPDPRAGPPAPRHAARHRPDRLGQDDDALRGDQRGQHRPRQDHHHRRPGRVPARGRRADPRQREERPDLLARPALHPAPRPRPGDGRRDPRRRDGPDRGAGGADRPPGVQHRACQQRLRCHRPLHAHGPGPVQRGVGPERGARPAPGAADLQALRPALCAGCWHAGPAWRHQRPVHEGRGLRPLPRHRLPGPARGGRTAQARRRAARSDRRPRADVRDQGRGEGARHEAAARAGPGRRLPWRDHFRGARTCHPR